MSESRIPSKLSVPSAGGFIPYDYGRVFFVEPIGESERLVIGPSSNQVELLIRLAKEFAADQFFILYVLLLSHAGYEPGRYQSPLLPSLSDLELALWSFSKFFETDGRHHIWVGAPDGQALLVYDQHNVIFAYGPLGRFQSVLEELGFTRKEFWFPVPHAHSFSPKNSIEEERLMKYWEWQQSPLMAGDEWD